MGSINFRSRISFRLRKSDRLIWINLPRPIQMGELVGKAKANQVLLPFWLPIKNLDWVILSLSANQWSIKNLQNFDKNFYYESNSALNNPSFSQSSQCVAPVLAVIQLEYSLTLTNTPVGAPRIPHGVMPWMVCNDCLKRNDECTSFVTPCSHSDDNFIRRRALQKWSTEITFTDSS